MKRRIKLAETRSADGAVLALQEHDGEFAIYCDGKELMHSRAADSERLLGQLGCELLSRSAPGRILIGGLGLGFTLRSALDASGPDTLIEVAELLPDLIDWNRTHLRGLNGTSLADPRVKTIAGDVHELIRRAGPATYDSILLDVDNGPTALIQRDNRSLYSLEGLRAIRAALKPGGRFVLWSAGADVAYENRIRRVGLDFRAVPAKRHARARRYDCILYVSDRP